jgi:lipoprotein-anchoring transpeptidase ErfK/SrfK
MFTSNPVSGFPMSELSRRAFLSGASAAGVMLGLAGCTTTRPAVVSSPVPAEPFAAGAPVAAVTSEPLDGVDGPSMAEFGPGGQFDYAAIYDRVEGDAYPIPRVDLRRIKRPFRRAVVPDPTGEAPGTIVVDPRAHYLYFVEAGGMARRYGVGVGREGFGWSGVATINSKQEWPDWYPPREMIARQPELRERLSRLQGGIGMQGGPGNPLGARAMYLWQNGKDTLFRIHGTVEPWTIGSSVSSGCIRMINQDAIDLYNRVAVGTKVVVLGGGGRPVARLDDGGAIGGGGAVDGEAMDDGAFDDPAL